MQTPTPKKPFDREWLEHKLQIIENTETVKFEKVGRPEPAERGNGDEDN